MLLCVQPTMQQAADVQPAPPSSVLGVGGLTGITWGVGRRQMWPTAQNGSGRDEATTGRREEGEMGWGGGWLAGR